MIKINLLPLEERQSKWPVDRLLIISGCLVVMILSCFYLYTIFEVWHIEGKLQDTRNQYQSLQPTRTIMAAANDKQQLISKKNNILTALTKEHQSWYGIIEHLTAVTLPQIWFTDMAKADDKGMIQIKGWAATYPLVAEFMKTMETDQFFVEPALNKVEKDATTQATKFEIGVKPRGI